MKFRVVNNSEKRQLKNRGWFNIYELPLIDNSAMIPLYTALSGTNIMQFQRSGAYRKSGVIVHGKHKIKDYTYICTDITITMLYIDKVEYYQQKHKEAVDTWQKEIYINAKDTEKIRYRLKLPKLGFQEQVYLQKTMPSLLPDMIQNQIEYQKQLKMLNLELI